MPSPRVGVFPVPQAIDGIRVGLADASGGVVDRAGEGVLVALLGREVVVWAATSARRPDRITKSSLIPARGPSAVVRIHARDSDEASP